jgi:three-Cys-motif partner protein
MTQMLLGIAMEARIDGSANIAVGLPDPFDNYLFIEKSSARLEELRQSLRMSYSDRLPRCLFEQGDANEVLRRWARQRNWKKERAVVFLDPYGMQVEWRTIEVLGATKGVDLWYLFPLGVGVSRLLTRRGDIDPSWQARLDALFGTQEWRQRFYQTNTTMPNLFGETHNTLERNASPTEIEDFITERLSSCFAGVAKGLVLRNSRSNPMYLLCFAAANERGAPIALRIVRHLLGE